MLKKDGSVFGWPAGGCEFFLDDSNHVENNCTLVLRSVCMQTLPLKDPSTALSGKPPRNTMRALQPDCLMWSLLSDVLPVLNEEHAQVRECLRTGPGRSPHGRLHQGQPPQLFVALHAPLGNCKRRGRLRSKLQLAQQTAGLMRVLRPHAGGHHHLRHQCGGHAGAVGVPDRPGRAPGGRRPGAPGPLAAAPSGRELRHRHDLQPQAREGGLEWCGTPSCPLVLARSAWCMPAHTHDSSSGKLVVSSPQAR